MAHAAFLAPSEADISIDLNILLFTLGVSLLTAMLFGLAPAIHTTKSIWRGP